MSSNLRTARPGDGPSNRLATVDLLRGLAIVLMALDHVREFLQAEQFDPLDLQRTTPALFFTRWITHFCPTIFILLAGAGIGLGVSDSRSRALQSRFILVRGVWLIVLELSVVHLAWFFNWQFHAALGQVIWAIGWSMICMAGLVFLPTRLIVASGVLVIAGHNAFDSVTSESFGDGRWLWSFLHTGGPISWGGMSIYIAYPLVPWVGLMAAGFGFGRFLRHPTPLRTRVTMVAGLLMMVAFAILRGGNIYGNPTPWTPQATSTFTVMSILNCQKYPPSLAYLLMTLGPTFALWPLWDRWRGPLAQLLIAFGRVPLFFYVLHLFVIHGLTVAIVYGQTQTVPDWLWSFPPGHAGAGAGVPLPVLYLVWIGVVSLHFPACLWYGRLKALYPGSVLRFL